MSDKKQPPKKRTRGTQKTKTGTIKKYWTERGNISSNTSVSMISNSA